MSGSGTISRVERRVVVLCLLWKEVWGTSIDGVKRCSETILVVERGLVLLVERGAVVLTLLVGRGVMVLYRWWKEVWWYRVDGSKTCGATSLYSKSYGKFTNG